MRKRLMGQFPLRQKEQSGIGAAAFSIHPESRYFARESKSQFISRLSVKAVLRRPASKVARDHIVADARLDIISDYAPKCGKRRWDGDELTSFFGDAAGSRTGREDIRNPHGAHGIAVADARGAKEIDCYV
ncbi:MAG: hypothetical protein KGI75_23640 [Rhizobiaceae bacterium]|nr:hypothetical protein [Rhizobiaceae bacterium]